MHLQAQVSSFKRSSPEEIIDHSELSSNKKIKHNNKTKIHSQFSRAYRNSVRGARFGCKLSMRPGDEADDVKTAAVTCPRSRQLPHQTSSILTLNKVHLRNIDVSSANSQHRSAFCVKQNRNLVGCAVMLGFYQSTRNFYVLSQFSIRPAAPGLAQVSPTYQKRVLFT